MSKEVWIGKKGFRYWYYKYRDSEYFSLAVMLSSVVICLVLIFQLILPQIYSWFSIREEIIATRERISVLQDNINFMNNLDRAVLNSQVDTATTALPPEKDFGSMLDVIAAASIASGVSLNDFSFQVGDVESSKGLVTDVRHHGLASIKVTVVAVGTVDGVRRFIENLEQSIPVSEVVNIDGSGQTVSVSVQFYQKPIADVDIKEDQPLQPLSSEKVALLQKLASWKKSSPLPNLNTNTSTRGAMPLF